jgi:hypothetical protein
MTGWSLRRLQERTVPAGTRSHYGTRRTVRDEGVGTREQRVRAPIRHSGAMAGWSLRRLQERTVPAGTRSHYGTRLHAATLHRGLG